MRFGFCLLVVGGFLVAAPTPTFAQKKQRDVISREEIEGSAQKDQNLLAVIRGLRPHFLAPPRGVRSMGGTDMMPTIVVVDGRQAGEIDALTQIIGTDVKEIRYLDPSRSQNQYGIKANGGAIVVTTLGAKGQEK
jgi:hypothetical protein